MLPPFVPPSARAAAESLPLITEFVYQRAERSFEETWSPEAQRATSALAVAEPPVSLQEQGDRDPVLPPITDFLAVTPSVVDAIPFHVSLPEVLVPPAIESDTQASGVQDSYVQNRDARDSDVQDTDVQDRDDTRDSDTPDVVADVNVEPDAKWVADERNAFDWSTVAKLANRRHEERRAEDDWASTDWERSAHSDADQISAFLTQIARRVRAGELKVDATRGMSAEAALAATLAALLRTDD